MELELSRLVVGEGDRPARDAPARRQQGLLAADPHHRRGLQADPSADGLALTGLGGLIAIHRTCNEEALREGLRTRRSTRSCSRRTRWRTRRPSSPRSSACSRRSAAATCFGLMLRITGACRPSIDDRPGADRRMGRAQPLRRARPHQRRSCRARTTTCCGCNLDAVGIFDFDQGTAAIDALLVDSRCSPFPAHRRRGAARALDFAAQLRARGRRHAPRLHAAGGLPDARAPGAQPDHRRQPAPHLRGLFRADRPTPCSSARARICTPPGRGFNVTGDAGFDVLIQLGRSTSWPSSSPACSSRKGSTQPVQGQGRRRARRAAAAVGAREVHVRDSVVGRLDPRQRHAGQRPAPAAAAGDRRARSSCSPRCATHAAGTASCRRARRASSRCARSPAASTPRRCRRASARHAHGAAERRAVESHARHRPVRRFAGRRRAAASASRGRRQRHRRAAGQPADAAQDDFAPAQFFEMSDERQAREPVVRADAGGPAHRHARCRRSSSPSASLRRSSTRRDRRSLAGADVPQRIRTLHVRYALPGAQLELHALHGAAGRSVLRREDPLRPMRRPRRARRSSRRAFAVIDAVLASAAAAPKIATSAAAGASQQRLRRGERHRQARPAAAGRADVRAGGQGDERRAASLFLPWVRQGLAARLATPDPLTTPLPAQAPLDGDARREQRPPPASARRAPVRPGRRDRHRSAPGRAHRAAGGQRRLRSERSRRGRVRQSRSAVAVHARRGRCAGPPASVDRAGGRAQAGRRAAASAAHRAAAGARDRRARACRREELPDLADSWAWAHAQLGWRTTRRRRRRLRNVLATRPELSVSRLLSPRLLTANTEYIACVVPAFEAGRLAGLGRRARRQRRRSLPAWNSGAERARQRRRCRCTTTGNSAPARARISNRSSHVSRRATFARPSAAADGHQPHRASSFRRRAAGAIPPAVLEGALQPVEHARARVPRRHDEAAGSRRCSRSSTPARAHAARPAAAIRCSARRSTAAGYAGRDRVGTARHADLARRAESRSARARRRRARHARDSGAAGRADGRGLGSGRRDGDGQSASAPDAAEPAIATSCCSATSHRSSRAPGGRHAVALRLAGAGAADAAVARCAGAPRRRCARCWRASTPRRRRWPRRCAACTRGRGAIARRSATLGEARSASPTATHRR